MQEPNSSDKNQLSDLLNTSLTARSQRRPGDQESQSTQRHIELLGEMGIGRTSMSEHSGFNNPVAYCTRPSVNPDLPFKSLASVFIKKSDHQ